MNPLHPRVTSAWRVAGVVTASCVAAVIAVLELWVLGPAGFYIVAPGIAAVVVLVIGLLFALTWPRFRYRCWGWLVEPDRVLIQKGVVWRSRSLIPRVRIQHVDTRTSPLQRWLGLSSLILYTAGTRGADAEIPGLETAHAEQLREELARLEDLDEHT